MKYSITMVILILIFSCRKEKNEIIEDNRELIELAEVDQIERENFKLDPKIIYKNDSLRREKVIYFEKNEKLKTSKDFYNASLIFQHGKDSTDYLKAVLY